MVYHDSVTLNTGAVMPAIGLGTWKSAPGEVEHAVEFALKTGYRHIDTAAAYGNEAEVGKGIKDSGVSRSEIFLTTKLNNPDHSDPLSALQSSLKSLDTPYLDLWLMHWPAPMKFDDDNKMVADKTLNWLDTWKAMVKVYKSHPDQVKAIGVSNFSIDYLEILFAEHKEGDVVPAVNQVELHPGCVQKELREYCKKKGIVVTAYSPLGSDGKDGPVLRENEVVKRIAKTHGVGVGTVLIGLQINSDNTTVLPKSVTKSRIEENLKMISLSDEEVQELNAINETVSFRACNPEWTGWGHLGFPDKK